MRKLVNFLAFLTVFCFVYFLLQSVYTGFLKTPDEVDSLSYHIPLAKNILAKGWWLAPKLPMGLGYYPAVGESLLALLLILGEKWLNIFNVAGLILVFAAAYLLGREFKLQKQLAVIYAVAVAFLVPGIRLVNNQTVDIWFEFFCLLAMFALASGRKYGSFLSGLSLGLTAGTKFSGPLAVFLIFLIGRKKLGRFSIGKALSFLLPLFLTGGFWYLRNFWQTGNPFFPGNLDLLGIHFRGHPGNRLTDWMPLKTVFLLPGGGWYLIESLVTEFNLWLVFVGWLVFDLGRDLRRVGGLKSRSREVVRLLVLGFFLFLIFFITPSWQWNFVSDLRYSLPGWALMLLSFFVYYGKKNIYLVLTAGIFSVVAVLPFLTYHPKLIFFLAPVVLGTVLLFSKKEKGLLL